MELKKYTHEQVLETATDYFGGDSLAANVWMNKYALKDSDGNIYELTPNEMHRRLASEVARIDANYPNPMSEDEFFELFRDFIYIIPQGSPMAGIGNDFQVSSLSNCFVIGSDVNSDSYGGIMKVDQEQVQLMKRRGGVGHDLSHIRPAGSRVLNSALTSTGIVPFMERYSNSTREVAQDGRRGALMLSVSIKHPDSEKFIDAKMEQGKVTGANISVKLDDEFMKAVSSGSEYTQQYPIHSLSPTTVKPIEAVKIWDKIVHNAWKSAEPGILFWDTIIRESVPDCYIDHGFKTISTNPCFSGKEKLLTPEGYKTFAELSKLGQIEIINSVGHIVTSKVWYSGDKETITLRDSQGNTFTCTPDHVWKTTDGNDVQAKDLKGKKLLPFLLSNNTYNDLFVKLGFIQGDGNLGRLKSDTHKGFEINIGANDDDVLRYFNLKREYPSQRKFYVTEYNETCNNLGFSTNNLPERNLPSTINEWKDDEQLSFLSGLFSANGSVTGNYRVSLKTTNKILVSELQAILKKFEIDSYYTTNKSKKVPFTNGEYVCKESYDLNIGKYYDLIKFYQKIGFIHQYKNDKLFKVIMDRSPKITKITKNGIISVYDFVEPETNWGVVNGCIAHNCGEIPLCAYDSCRLLAINLYSYVKNPFTVNAVFDMDLFQKHAAYALRIMDDIVDLEIEKIKNIINKIDSDPEDDETKYTEKNLWLKILSKTIQGRRTGIGITAEGDMIAALGLRYGTEEATNVSVQIHKTLALAVYNASADLAIERGSFPIFDMQKEKDNPFIQRLLNESPELAEKMQKTGRRNISMLTIAPTGSVSICTQTSSGIEPVFMVNYKRRRKVNPNDKNVKVVFVDEVGDSWEEFNVFHPKFIDWMKINKYDVDKAIKSNDDDLQVIINQSPYYKATSNDIDWVAKVKMQGEIQKWVDHSISVTVNLPADATESLVSDVYLTAWKSGCKGITVYRDGSRSGVLVSNEKPKEHVHAEETHALPRPKTVDCDVIRFMNDNEKWVAFLGFVGGHPYEIFTGLAEEFPIPSYVTKGKIRRVKDNGNGSRYDVLYIDKGGMEQEIRGLNRVFNPEYWTYAKLISGLLRNRMHLLSLIHTIQSLNHENDTINTWFNGVVRTLKKYIKDGTEDEKEGKCPVCNATLQYIEGCLTCTCGEYSKCG